MAVNFGFTVEEIIKDGLIEQFEIEEVKSWSLKQTNLPFLTDEQLAIFLLSCDKNKERAQKTIMEYYRIKLKVPQFFTNRDVDRENILKVFQCSAATAVLPVRTESGDAVVVHKLPAKCSELKIESYIEIALMVLDSVLYEKPAKGIVILIDLKQAGLMHISTLRYTPLKSFFWYLQEGLPLRLKAVHIVNMFPYLDKLMTILSPLTKREVLDLFHYHYPKDNFKDLHVHVSKKCLPEDYGGELSSLTSLQEETFLKLRGLKSFFNAEEAQWNQEINRSK